MNPAGRFNSLHNIYAVTDSAGQPLFSISNNAVTFHVMRNDEPHWLWIPIGINEQQLLQFETNAINNRNKNNRQLAECLYFKKEFLVYDTLGRGAWHDIILQRKPAGLPLTNFIRTQLFVSDRKPFRELLTNLAQMSDTFHRQGIIHGKLKAENIIVGNDFALTALNHATITEKSATADNFALAHIAIVAYILGGEARVYMAAGGKSLFRPDVLSKHIRHIRTQAEFSKITPLTELTIALSDISKYDRATINEQIKALAVTPFVSMPLLVELLSASESGQIVSITPATANHNATRSREDKSLRIDFADCLYVADISDTIIRFQTKDGLWGFADKYGNTITTARFTYAGDFYEGRAEIATHNGYGLIDREGTYIIEPTLDVLEWHGTANIAAGCADGKWDLYDRNGERITYGKYDWLGGCEENILIARRENKFGFIRANGERVTELRYDEAYSFHNGKALVRAGNESYHISTDGIRTNDK